VILINTEQREQMVVEMDQQVVFHVTKIPPHVPEEGR
jgi:hypothetical protein